MAGRGPYGDFHFLPYPLQGQNINYVSLQQSGFFPLMRLKFPLWGPLRMTAIFSNLFIQHYFFFIQCYNLNRGFSFISIVFFTRKLKESQRSPKNSKQLTIPNVRHLSLLMSQFSLKILSFELILGSFCSISLHSTSFETERENTDCSDWMV